MGQQTAPGEILRDAQGNPLFWDSVTQTYVTYDKLSPQSSIAKGAAEANAITGGASVRPPAEQDPEWMQALRQYALDLMGGKYAGDADQMYGAQAPGIDYRASEGAHAWASNMASRGLSRSGMMAGGVGEVERKRAQEHYQARAKAGADVSARKQRQAGQGSALMRGMGDIAQREKIRQWWEQKLKGTQEQASGANDNDLSWLTG